MNPICRICKHRMTAIGKLEEWKSLSIVDISYHYECVQCNDKTLKVVKGIKIFNRKSE